jgi:hypothetical protein
VIDTIEANVQEVVLWAARNNVRFKGADDLIVVNNKRSRQGKPLFVLRLSNDTSCALSSPAIPYVVVSAGGRSLPAPKPTLPEKTCTSISTANKDSPAMDAPAQTVPAVIDQAGHSVTMPPEAPSKPMPRTMQGLSDAMFDVVDEFRAGRKNLDDVKAICNVASQIVTMLHAQIKVLNLAEKATDAQVREKLLKLVG